MGSPCTAEFNQSEPNEGTQIFGLIYVAGLPNFILDLFLSKFQLYSIDIIVLVR